LGRWVGARRGARAGDVAAERARVEEGDGRPGDKVTLQRTTKTYPGHGPVGIGLGGWRGGAPSVNLAVGE